MIYVFGDSHRAFFTYTHPGDTTVREYDIFKSYNVGATTAHNFLKHDNSITNYLKGVDKDVNCVLLTAGDIDCRLHIPKIHIETGKRIPELVENTVLRFVSVMKHLQDKGYKVIVWGPHPTKKLEETTYNPEWYAGNQMMRNQTAMAFNAVLQNAAAKLNMPFVTPFYTLIKSYEDYSIYEEVYRDDIHLNNILWPSAKKVLGDIHDNYADF